MPIYDFRCLQCKQVFEFLLLKNSELPRCPACGSGSVVRHAVSIFSCTGIQLTKRLKLESEDRMKKGDETNGRPEIEEGTNKNYLTLLSGGEI